jgi:hypothetical protein
MDIDRKAEIINKHIHRLNDHFENGYYHHFTAAITYIDCIRATIDADDETLQHLADKYNY